LPVEEHVQQNGDLPDVIIGPMFPHQQVDDALRVTALCPSFSVIG